MNDILSRLERAGLDTDRQFIIEYAEGNDDLTVAVIRYRDTKKAFLFVVAGGIGGLCPF